MLGDIRKTSLVPKIYCPKNTIKHPKDVKSRAKMMHILIYLKCNHIHIEPVSTAAIPTFVGSLREFA